MITFQLNTGKNWNYARNQAARLKNIILKFNCMELWGAGWHTRSAYSGAYVALPHLRLRWNCIVQSGDRGWFDFEFEPARITIWLSSLYLFYLYFTIISIYICSSCVCQLAFYRNDEWMNEPKILSFFSFFVVLRVMIRVSILRLSFVK